MRSRENERAEQQGNRIRGEGDVYTAFPPPCEGGGSGSEVWALSMKDTGIELAGRLALRMEEAAEALGIAEGTVRNYLPQIPHFRLGRTLLFPVDGLRKWLSDQADTQRSRADKAVEEILSSVDPQRKD
jgi:hypothetical protein